MEETKMSKNVLVTGAARGFGFLLCKLHLENGDRVFAAVRATNDQLNELAKQYDRLTIVTCDVASTESTEAGMRDVIGKVDHLDILYNNAAINNDDAKCTLPDTDLDDYVRIYNTNAVGAMRAIKAALPLLKKGALICNISSEAGSISSQVWRTAELSYCMSKAAMNMSARILANYFRPQGIRFLSVHPGWMRTDMGTQAADIDPMESAKPTFDMALNIDKLSPEIEFLDYTGEPRGW